MKTTVKTLTPYQQIEVMVENGVCVTLDVSYEDSRFIVSISHTSAFNVSFDDESLPNAIEKAYDHFMSWAAKQNVSPSDDVNQYL